MSNSKKASKSLLSLYLVLCTQALVSVLLVYGLLRLNIIPKQILMVIVGGIMLALLIMAIVLVRRNGAVAKVLSVLMSLVMVVGVKYVFDVESALRNITNANKDTYVISVIVRADSEYHSIEDVKALPFAANMRLDGKNIENSKQLFDEKFKFIPTLDEYSRYQSMVGDLLDGTIDVMLLSEGHRTYTEEIDHDFSDKTRIVGFVSTEVSVDLPTTEKDLSKDSFTVSISGLDTYGPISTAAGSDVNLILTISPQTGQILMTSVPRDYHVVLGTIGAYDKLTHSGIYGAAETVKTLENLMDIKIDYYLKLNFNSLEDIVDYIGGVDVNSRYTFKSRHGKYSFVEGSNYVDGKKALAFVRERYALPNGDEDRVVHQQELMVAILKKVATPSSVLNYRSLLNLLDSGIETNMPTSDLKELIQGQFSSHRSWTTHMNFLGGYDSSSTSTYSMPDWNLYVKEPNFESINRTRELMNQVLNNNIISIEH